MQVRLRRGLKLLRSVQSSMRFARFKAASQRSKIKVQVRLRERVFTIINYQLSIINYKLSTLSFHFCLTTSLAGVDEEQAEEEDDGEIAECRMLIDVVEHGIDEHRQAEHIHADESPLR